MFCPKCGSLLRPEKRDGSIVFVCPSCGYESSGSEGGPELATSISRAREETVALVESSAEVAAPKVKALCPNCGHNEAYMTMVQTRSADEPPTRIYRCVKCGYVWREYA
ncbi:MAG: transcription factor S [Thermoproteota archaeon]|nr:MAG: transcription factor S [Candidatus Korarchaeota archaeon]